MSGDVFIALDQGGQSSRAIAYDGEGRELQRASRPVTTTRPGPGRVEHDGEEILRGLWAALDEVLAALGPGAAANSRIGLATQRSTVAFWNKETGALLAPCISWQDTRGALLLERQSDSFRSIRARTGLWPSAHHGASKLAWAVENLVPVARAHHAGRLTCGPLAAFLAGRLTESFEGFVDANNAGRTLLWSRWTGTWDEDIVNLFGLHDFELPPCVVSQAEHGLVATRFGAIPFELLLGDQPAVLWSHGPPHAGTAHVNIGTGAFCLRTVGGRADEVPRLLQSLAWCNDEGEETWVVEGTVNGGASALDWARRTLSLSAADAAVGANLDEVLAASPGPPLFLNGVSGLGSPYWRTSFEPRFIGDGSARELLAGVLESIAFLLARNLAELATLEPPLTRIVASGGLSAVDGLCARLASLSGLEVVRPDEIEGTARGTACLLAGRPSNWGDGTSGARSFAPLPDEALAERYRAFVSALEGALAGE